nr:hypothetical protein [Pseudomonadota bacterium]
MESCKARPSLADFPEQPGSRRPLMHAGWLHLPALFTLLIASFAPYPVNAADPTVSCEVSKSSSSKFSANQASRTSSNLKDCGNSTWRYTVQV